jgi:hypothetical protein
LLPLQLFLRLNSSQEDSFPCTFLLKNVATKSVA